MHLLIIHYRLRRCRAQELHLSPSRFVLSRHSKEGNEGAFDPIPFPVLTQRQLSLPISYAPSFLPLGGPWKGRRMGRERGEESVSVSLNSTPRLVLVVGHAMDSTKGSLQKAASRSSKEDEEGGERAAHDHNVKSTSSDSGIGYEVIERRGDVARSQSMKSRVRYLVPSFFFLLLASVSLFAL